MKKFVSSILFFGAVSAFAVPQENVGVGVGTMIFENSDGLMSQTAAVTTNHIFCNQTIYNQITYSQLRLNITPYLSAEEAALCYGLQP